MFHHSGSAGVCFTAKELKKGKNQFIFLPSFPPTIKLLKAPNSLAANPALSLGKFFSSRSPALLIARTAFRCDFEAVSTMKQEVMHAKTAEWTPGVGTGPGSRSTDLTIQTRDMRLPCTSCISIDQLTVYISLQISHQIQGFEFFLPSPPEKHSHFFFHNSKN